MIFSRFLNTISAYLVHSDVRNFGNRNHETSNTKMVSDLDPMVSGLAFCGHSLKHFAIVIYNSRVSTD